MSAHARFTWHARLLLCLGLGVLLAGCGASSALPPPSGPVETWIRQHAIPLTTVEPGAPDSDLLPFQPIVGQASIVGLGEATHGTHEFFAVKARLIEYLVSHLGFTIVAMENGWDESRAVDAYVQTGQGDAQSLLQQDFYGAWRAQEVLGLLTWLRAYNADPSHATKVHFVGIDSWNITQAAFDDVARYVQTVDPRQTAQVQALYVGIRPPTAAPTFVDDGGFSHLPEATKQQDAANAQEVYDLLQSHQAAYEARSSAAAFALALHSARVIVQYTTLGVLIPASGTLFSTEAAYDRRDAFMAENVEWLHNQSGGTARIALWAHNTHIASLHQPQNMGAYLRARYQDAYLRVGTSFYQGSYTVLRGGPPQVATVPPPNSDSYNYTLGHAEVPRYILDIRQTPSGAVTDWAQGPHGLLGYGVGGQDLEAVGALQYWFNVIVHAQVMTPSHLLA
jgi:erythromycin esterase